MHGKVWVGWEGVDIEEVMCANVVRDRGKVKMS
jgi:hypothetical protein